MKQETELSTKDEVTQGKDEPLSVAVVVAVAIAIQAVTFLIVYLTLYASWDYLCKKIILQGLS